VEACRLQIDPYVAAAGLLVGFTVGLTGMGGGTLMTPLLVLLFKVQPLAAVSSDLGVTSRGCCCSTRRSPGPHLRTSHSPVPDDARIAAVPLSSLLAARPAGQIGGLRMTLSA
jgi:Sulfite exporter TauE/SafE